MARVVSGAVLDVASWPWLFVAADALAIFVSRLLGARLPERTIRIGAALIFLAFGVLLIVEGLS